jgi:acyl carrier protein
MNKDTYDSIFMDVFSLQEASLNESLLYQSVEMWDSVGHMELISRLEDAFGINLEMDDVIDFSSYLEGKNILTKYGIKFDEQN